MQTEPQKCTAMATAVNVNQLPEIAEGTCAETSRTFSITRAEDGSLTLTVSQPVTPESDQTGTGAGDPLAGITMSEQDRATAVTTDAEAEALPRETDYSP